MTRNDHKIKIIEKAAAFEKAKMDLYETIQDYIKINDSQSSFKEEFEGNELVGRRYFNQKFKDESNGEVISIPRSRVVHRNNKWNIDYMDDIVDSIVEQGNKMMNKS